MARKVIGGLAYPYKDKPGYAVVVAVDYDAKDPKKKPTYKVLAEAENMNVATLVQECLRLQDQHEPGTFQLWYGDSMNLPMMSIWAKVGNGRFLFSTPPHFGEPGATSFYLQAIGAIIPKDLSFRKNSKLPSYLTEVLLKDIVDISEYPPHAALGYALGVLYDKWLPLEYEKEPKTPAQKIIDHVEKGGTSDDLGGGFFPEDDD
jgi:hypothetical protein